MEQVPAARERGGSELPVREVSKPQSQTTQWTLLLPFQRPWSPPVPTEARLITCLCRGLLVPGTNKALRKRQPPSVSTSTPLREN